MHAYLRENSCIELMRRLFSSTVAISQANHYQVLAVARTASQSEIKKSFKKLSLKYHPDLIRYDDMSEEQIKQQKDLYIQILASYECLMDEKLRREYDEKSGAQRHHFKQAHQGGFSNLNKSRVYAHRENNSSIFTGMSYQHNDVPHFDFTKFYRRMQRVDQRFQERKSWLGELKNLHHFNEPKQPHNSQSSNGMGYVVIAVMLFGLVQMLKGEETTSSKRIEKQFQHNKELPLNHLFK